MRFLMRAYAYLFQLVICIAMIALALVAITGTVNNFRLPMLPWEGSTLAAAVLVLGIVGLIAVLLALAGVFRAALPVWAFIVLVLLVRGWFASSYTFANASGFYAAVWVTFGALLAFIFSFSVFRRAEKKY